LDKYFISTVLNFELLFDTDKHVHVVQNVDRNKGFGVCLDKVELMVNKMITKAGRSDVAEEKMIFDPAEILDRQYQRKLCASVEVTLRPYRANDRSMHMAHHFREVSSHSFED
jgi:hypothetical protein